ncbi:MAG TPA: hypothetical protein VJ732_14180, partial [Bryobacteraceae bacterium]|nr:hypothetical protein [Bryobacteraceae bacterium]
LYRPFAAHPQPALVARAYVADNPSHILQSGETSPLLVEVECVGPAGSSTPALTAVAEPETGLAAAAGMVNIPALHAGQMTIVRVPRVTAGNDSSGDLFRLRLKVQEEGERTRRIVLEGRIGFSRLTWGLSPKGQMFPAPGGERLIAGEPGFSALIATDTLHTQMIATPKDTVVGTAVFSFDGSHVALGLVDPAKKAEAVAIVNSQLGSPQYLAAGSHFIRWLDKDRFLLEDQNRLVSRSVLGGPDRAFEVPDGWSSTIIPGTEVQILSKPGGKLAVRNGTGPLREVLTGVVLKKSVAVANDLTVFGAVDDQQRFWVQRGLDAAPAVVAEGVEQVIWGPISHLAVVRQANGKSRVYDGRDNSWLDLGAVSEAQWSPDEQRLLFVQPASGGEPGTLRLLAGRQVRTLYDLKKIGPVAHIAFASHDRVFLQAAPTGEAGVWMMALPPRPAEAN